MAEHLSVFDIFKIGIGPSSSHTLGPWRAALRCLSDIENRLGSLDSVNHIQCLLYGSLAKTGIGHGTDIAVLLGLTGADPVTFDVGSIESTVSDIKNSKKILINGIKEISFDYDQDILFLKDECLEYHPNGMTFLLQCQEGNFSYTYYSIGGGFVVTESEDNNNVLSLEDPTFPVDTADDVLHNCQKSGMTIAEMAYENELTWLSEDELKSKLQKIRTVMDQCIYRGMHTPGILPGGLQVRRRSADICKNLLGDKYSTYQNRNEWLEIVKAEPKDMMRAIDWLNSAALAVNEENASFSRVVTAPTNGAAGVLPAVLFFLQTFHGIDQEQEDNFILAASVIGMIFKKGATISAAMGGCQAEIGVSSAMAAAAYTEILGGTVKQALVAAEIAMEHHLGLTCDPVAGLVQIPCIERNCMGAIKAITAARLALKSNPYHSKVSLDAAVKTMWDTAQDMNTKYKETSDGGLAFQFSEGLIEC